MKFFHIRIIIKIHLFWPVYKRARKNHSFILFWLLACHYLRNSKSPIKSEHCGTVIIKHNVAILQSGKLTWYIIIQTSSQWQKRCSVHDKASSFNLLHTISNIISLKFGSYLTRDTLGCKVVGCAFKWPHCFFRVIFSQKELSKSNELAKNSMVLHAIASGALARNCYASNVHFEISDSTFL